MATKSKAAEQAAQQAKQSDKPEDAPAAPEKQAAAVEPIAAHDVTAAAPLAAPERAAQLEPADGHADSSTDNVAAQAALRSPAGANFVRLVDPDGKALDVAKDVFEYPASGEDPKTTATVKTHVVEVYTSENARTASQQLLLTKGQEVPLGQVSQIIAKYEELAGAAGDGS